MNIKAYISYELLGSLHQKRALYNYIFNPGLTNNECPPDRNIILTSKQLISEPWPHTKTFLTCCISFYKCYHNQNIFILAATLTSAEDQDQHNSMMSTNQQKPQQLLHNMTSSLQQQPHNIGRQSSSVIPPPPPTQYSHPPPDNLGVGMVVGGPPMLQQPPPNNSHPHPNQQMIGKQDFTFED